MQWVFNPFTGKFDAAASGGGGGGAVDSVNGQTGVVVLTAADVGAVSAETTIILADTTGYGNPTISGNYATYAELAAAAAAGNFDAGEYYTCDDQPDNDYFYNGYDVVSLNRAQRTLSPYIVNAATKQTILCRANGGADQVFLVLPDNSGSGPYDETAWLATVTLDTQYTIDTSTSAQTFICSNAIAGENSAFSVIYGASNQWALGGRNLFTAEWYANNWTPTGQSGLLFRRGGGDGWGNGPSVTSSGRLSRYTLSQAQWNSINVNLGRVVTISTPGITNILPTDDAGNHPYNTTVIATVAGATARIWDLFSSGINVGQRVRFLDSVGGNILILGAEGSGFRPHLVLGGEGHGTVTGVNNFTGDGVHTVMYNSTVDIWYFVFSATTPGDTVEVQYVGNNNWRYQIFDFASWQNGQQPWGSVSKIGALPADVGVTTSPTEYFVSSSGVNSGSSWTSVAAAIAAITDASASKPYVVKVLPGIYTEAPFSLKAYVSIIGEGTYYNTIIKTSSATGNFITGTWYSEIRGVAVEGPTTSGAAIYYAGAGTDSTTKNYPFKVIEVAVRAGVIGVHADGAATTNRVQVHCINVVNVQTADTVGTMFKATGKSNLVSMSSAVMSGSGVGIAFHCQSTDASHKAEVTLDLCSMKAATTGLKIEGVSGGIATARLDGCSLTGGTTGILATYASFNAAGCVITDDVATTHISCDANTTGQYSGVMNKGRLAITAGANFSASFTDGTTGEQGQVVFGELWLGSSKLNSIPLKDYGLSTYSTGWVSGGVVSKNATPLYIDVTAGYGYVNDGLGVYKVSWLAATHVAVASNTKQQYVYYTPDGSGGSTLTVSTTEPSYNTSILVASVDTDSTKIISISDHKVPINYHVPRMAAYLEDVVGPISTGGGVTTPSTTGVRVTSGAFYRIFDEISFAGSPSSNITFYPTSRGSGNAVYGVATTTIDATQYDSGTGAFTALTAGQYAKHSLYLVVDAAGNQTFFMVYGQQAFASQILAETGASPIAPANLQAYALRLAGVVVAYGSANVVSCTDERPKLGQMANASTSVTNHNDLAGIQGDGYYHLSSAQRDAAASAVKNGGGTAVITSQTTPPSTPSVGDIWIDTDATATVMLAAANNLSDVTSPTVSRNNILPSKVGNALKLLGVNAGETDYALVNAPGGGFSFQYGFSTTTAGSPSTGTIQLNNATPSAATLIYFSETDAHGVSIDAFIDDLAPPDMIMFSNADRSVFHVFQLTGTFVSGAGNDSIPVSYVFGTGTNFANGESIYFSRTVACVNDLYGQIGVMMNARYYMYL